MPSSTSCREGHTNLTAKSKLPIEPGLTGHHGVRARDEVVAASDSKKDETCGLTGGERKLEEGI